MAKLGEGIWGLVLREGRDGCHILISLPSWAAWHGPPWLCAHFNSRCRVKETHWRSSGLTQVREEMVSYPKKSLGASGALRIQKSPYPHRWSQKHWGVQYWAVSATKQQDRPLWIRLFSHLQEHFQQHLCLRGSWWVVLFRILKLTQ